MKTQPTYASILGLSFEGRRVDAALLRRQNGGFRVEQSLTFMLSTDPQGGDSEQVGHELRKHLVEAGIRERRCTVCVPLNWVSTAETELPDVSGDDLAGFFDIEAERRFHYGQQSIALRHSQYRNASGGQSATLVAIPCQHLEHLENSLRTAQLQPVSFTLGVSLLQRGGDDADDGVLAVALGSRQADMQIRCGGGIAGLRTLNGAVTTGDHRFHAAHLAREIRITLGNLPPELGRSIRKVRLFGDAESVQRTTRELSPLLESIGLDCEQAPSEWAQDTVWSPALVAAARLLTGVPPAFEFLPPKVGALERFLQRFASRKLVWIAGVLGGAALLAAVAMLVQFWQLSQLESQWAGMEETVVTLDGMQQDIKKFRPWHDRSHVPLTILKTLTEAFPQSGSVTARTIEIREAGVVHCTGNADDHPAMLDMLDRLRAVPGVTQLNVGQIRGKSPMQFTFQFVWQKGGVDAAK